jgi:hypothetical protein
VPGLTPPSYVLKTYALKLRAWTFAPKLRAESYVPKPRTWAYVPKLRASVTRLSYAPVEKLLCVNVQTEAKPVRE